MASGAMFTTRVEMDASEMLKGLGDLRERLTTALKRLGDLMAARIASAAKAGRVWTDRTSDARNGLTARAVMEGQKLVIYLYHVMHYGLWLEVKNGGTYAIIMQTLQKHYPEVVAMAGRLLMGG
jgi:hypothetical protein